MQSCLNQKWLSKTLNEAIIPPDVRDVGQSPDSILLMMRLRSAFLAMYYILSHTTEQGISPRLDIQIKTWEFLLSRTKPRYYSLR